jgi:hypothetical protein
MRTALIWSILLMLLVGVGHSQSTRQSTEIPPTISLEIIDVPAEHDANKPLLLKCVLRNRSEDVLRIEQVKSLPPHVKEYRITAFDENDQLVAYTRYGRSLYDAKIEEGGFIGVDIRPGEQYLATLPVGRICDLSMRGRYRITVFREVFIRGVGRTRITSSPAIISIVSGSVGAADELSPQPIGDQTN